MFVSEAFFLLGHRTMKKSTTVPPGSPSWVTKELIAKTIRVWQPYYKEKLTEEDALEMLINVGQVFNALGLTKVARPSASQVPEASELPKKRRKKGI